MRRVLLGCASLFIAQTVACNLEDPAPAEKPVAHQSLPIIGGTQDNVNSATVYLEGIEQGQGYSCSGTIIAVNGNVGYVLTAGHCVAGTIQTVVIGANLNTAVAHTALQQWQHPNYNTQTLNYDFGMVAFDGADASTPIVQAATSPDGVAPNGTQLDMSGYGKTSSGQTGPTTHRMHVSELTNDLSAIQPIDTSIKIGFDQQNGTGTCSGDSGGPAYLGTGSARRVVGVTSYGDQNCAIFGVSGRVSAVYSTFIQPILNGQPPTQTCNTCVSSATSPGGSCDASVQACTGDAQCSALLTCFNACNANDQACFNACGTAHPAGVAKYNAIIDCAYCSSCTTLCDQSQCGSPTTSATTSTGATKPTTSSTSSATGAGNGAGGAGGADPSTGSGNANTGGGNGSTTVTKCAACAVAPEDDGYGALAGMSVMGVLGLALSARRRRR